MYSYRDVEMIRRISTLSKQGVPLARAAELAQSEQAIGGERTSTVQGIVDKMIASLLAYDENSAAAEWTTALDLLDVQSAFERVIVPVMREIGQAWHAGEASIAQEHFATNFVRSRLDMLSRQVLPPPGAPIVLLACLEGEHHELGLLMLAVVLRFHGFRTIYLGQDVPTDALIRCVEDSQPQVVAVNAGTVEGAIHLEALAKALRETAPLSELVFGGGAFDAEPTLRREAIAHYGGADLQSAVRLITQLGRKYPAGGIR